MDVLITGAAGKTGLAVLKALKKRNMTVRAFAYRKNQGAILTGAGADEVICGDLTTMKSVEKAMDGVKSVYHICPNMHQSEVEIGSLAIKSAREAGIKRFVYHSVLHPQVEKMPHHWFKMRVEELLFESGLNYTILQPAPYMQNILAVKDSILKDNSYPVPYSVSTRTSLLDLEDLGEAAAIVLGSSAHSGAVYELVGTGALSQMDIAGEISEVLGREIGARQIPIDRWRKNAEQAGISPHQIEALVKMFDYYTCYGLWGSNFLLKGLIGREPNSLSEFLRRELAERL